MKVELWSPDNKAKFACITNVPLRLPGDFMGIGEVLFGSRSRLGVVWRYDGALDKNERDIVLLPDAGRVYNEVRQWLTEAAHLLHRELSPGVCDLSIEQAWDSAVKMYTPLMTPRQACQYVLDNMSFE